MAQDTAVDDGKEMFIPGGVKVETDETMPAGTVEIRDKLTGRTLASFTVPSPDNTIFVRNGTGVPVGHFTVPPRVTIADDVRQAAQAITSQPGFSVETGFTWTGEACLTLIAPPAGRGKARAKYLIVAPTLAAAFRALAEVSPNG